MLVKSTKNFWRSQSPNWSQLRRSVSSLKPWSSRSVSATTTLKKTKDSLVPSDCPTPPSQNCLSPLSDPPPIACKPSRTESHASMKTVWRNSTKTKSLSRSGPSHTTAWSPLSLWWRRSPDSWVTSWSKSESSLLWWPRVSHPPPRFKRPERPSGILFQKL